MRSGLADVLPPRLRRSLAKFGADIAIARRKRRLSIAMMVERVGVSKDTYQRVERGDPKVAVGVYAMALFTLGFGDVFGDLVDRKHDETGLLLDDELLPKRIRNKRTPV